jgi:hypothetical protein
MGSDNSIKPSGPRVGYSSHGCTSSWSEIRDIEVYDRGNYTPKEVKRWEKKYGLKPDTQVVWITESKRYAVSYDAWASEYEKIMGMSDADLAAYIESGKADEPETFDLNNGRIIVESNDGDEGYLFIPALSERGIIDEVEVEEEK